MTDCAHWLEPMLEAEKDELKSEKRARQSDIRKAQDLINNIRALINTADAHFSGFPSALPRPGIEELLIRQQMEAQRQQPHPFGLGNTQRGGLFNGLFGGLWPL